MKKWAFRIACVLLILAGFAFLTLSSVISWLYDGIVRAEILNYVMLAAIAAGFWCLFYKTAAGSKRLTVAKNLILAALGLLTISGYLAFCFCIPKYTVRDACAVVTAKPPFISSEVKPTHRGWPTGIDGNLFVKHGYTLDWYDDGGPAGIVRFEPFTGEYVYFLPLGLSQIETESFLSTYPQDFPFKPDNTVHINLVLNNPGAAKRHAGEWKLPDRSSMGRSLQGEREVKAFLQDMGKHTLRDQLDDITIRFMALYEMEKSSDMPPLEELTVEFTLHGVDIAAFQNGRIALNAFN